jgi:hypothetical protein
MLDPSSSPSASVQGSNILRLGPHGTESIETAAFFGQPFGLATLAHGYKRSLFALFSPKLWTALNQYGAGDPCVMRLHEWPHSIEFENLSLDQFNLKDAATDGATKALG